LLFNKDSLGRSDFGIKTQDINGNPIHNLEHSVECELMIDENILTLKKVFSEKWTKKRGSADAEFSGHETKYFVNEVPTTKKDYETKITNIIDETLFKIITNPLYFNEHMKWQDRRAILLNLCDNISDEEILAGDEKFKPLSSELKGRTVQEYKKIVQSKQTAINDELKAIPQRISEATLAIPAVNTNVDVGEKESIEKKIADLNEEINVIKSDSGVTTNETEIKILQEKKIQAENSKCDTATLNQELFDAKFNLQNVDREISDCKKTIASINIEIDIYTQTADTLRKEWHEVNEKQYTNNGICPTCGQPLPEEQIAEAKAKFNTDRAAKLESITEKGKKAKAEIEIRENLRLAEAEKIDALQKRASEYKTTIELLTEAIEKTKVAFEDAKLKLLREIISGIAEATKRLQNSEDDTKVRIYTIQEQIAENKAKLSEIDKVIAEQSIATKQKERIAELSANEKRLAGEYAELEKMAFLIDEFIKHKIELLSEEINNHFKLAKFKLFETQINGGVAECCEVTYKGVPYSDLNNAARISIGIDVINTLCKLNDKYAPIFVDNSESITNIPQATSQMICLVVSAGDNALRIEKNI
jgi:chromosome segregation ATPase